MRKYEDNMKKYEGNMKKINMKKISWGGAP